MTPLEYSQHHSQLPSLVTPSRSLRWCVSPAGWACLIVLILLPIPNVDALTWRADHPVLHRGPTPRDIHGCLVAADPETPPNVVTHLILQHVLLGLSAASSRLSGWTRGRDGHSQWGEVWVGTGYISIWSI